MSRTLRLFLPAALVALAACGDGSPLAGETATGPAVTRGTSPLEDSFDQIAAEYLVPKDLLKAIAHLETRVQSPGATASITGGYGLMNLVDREDWSALKRGAELTGAERGRIILDDEENLRAAAAFLRELADHSFADYPNLNPHDVADWWHAVTLYPGLDSATDAARYAAQVFRTIEDGFELERADGTVVLAPTHHDWQRHAPIETRKDAAKEYPGAYQWQASPNYSAGRSSYEYVIIHTVQGSYAGCISWFKNPASNVSAHYVVRSSDGQVTQMVEHQNTAWHASCYNGRSIGIEHEGYAQDPGAWYTDAMYTESAKLTKWIADRHGIPKTRSRILGHVEIPSACNANAHWDPGSGWNWTKYMALVNGSTPTTGTGLLKGVIYTGADTNNRVSGATVTAGGQSLTTGTDGTYQFSLAPGTYTVSVSKSGYTSNSVSRTVTVGATVWGSMEINAVSTTGTLIGVIYQGGDTNDRVGGAVITVAGKTVTTAADGVYEFTLAPGTYTVTASKSGYQNATVTRTVASGATVWGSMELKASTPTDTTPPNVTITFPGNGAALDLAVVTLTGTVTDDAGAIGQVQLRINGGTPATLNVKDGAFSQQIKLSPGMNELEVSATDAAGNAAVDEVQATFRAGLSGFVHVIDDEPARIPDAVLRLLDPATGDTLHETTTDDAGAFAFDVAEVGVDVILTVRAQGFLTRSETITLPDDERLSLKLPMTEGADPLPSEVGIRFIDPIDGATITGEQVTIYGSVDGFQVVAVTVNDVTAELIGAGGFAATVPLEPGANTIEAIAVGVGGESVTGTLTLYRVQAGDAPGDSLAPVAGGCAQVPGTALLALAALLPLLLSRRVERSARRRAPAPAAQGPRGRTEAGRG